MSNGVMARKLEINFSTFSNKLHGLGLYRMHFEYWTQEQISFLKKNYKKIGDKELAIIFNGLWDKEKRWSFKHIEKKRKYMGLKRTPAQIAAIKIRNRKRGCWSQVSKWKTRGACPDGTIKIWNNSWPTSFGVIRARFKVIKVNGAFVHYARWLYETTYGPMKPGYVVGFKDRNNMNVVPGNLEAITRGEHARRNRTKYPEEINSLEQILNQLNQTLKQKK